MAEQDLNKLLKQITDRSANTRWSAVVQLGDAILTKSPKVVAEFVDKKLLSYTVHPSSSVRQSAQHVIEYAAERLRPIYGSQIVEKLMRDSSNARSHAQIRTMLRGHFEPSVGLQEEPSPQFSAGAQAVRAEVAVESPPVVQDETRTERSSFDSIVEETEKETKSDTTVINPNVVYLSPKQDVREEPPQNVEEVKKEESVKEIYSADVQTADASSSEQIVKEVESKGAERTTEEDMATSVTKPIEKKPSRFSPFFERLFGKKQKEAEPEQSLSEQVSKALAGTPPATEESKHLVGETEEKREVVDAISETREPSLSEEKSPSAYLIVESDSHTSKVEEIIPAIPGEVTEEGKEIFYKFVHEEMVEEQKAPEPAESTQIEKDEAPIPTELPVNVESAPQDAVSEVKEETQATSSDIQPIEAVSSEQTVKEDMSKVAEIPTVEETASPVTETKEPKPSWFSAFFEKLFGSRRKSAKGSEPSLVEQDLQRLVTESSPSTDIPEVIKVEETREEKEQSIEFAPAEMLSKQDAVKEETTRVDIIVKTDSGKIQERPEPAAPILPDTVKESREAKVDTGSFDVTLEETRIDVEMVKEEESVKEILTSDAQTNDLTPSEQTVQKERAEGRKTPTGEEPSLPVAEPPKEPKPSWFAVSMSKLFGGKRKEPEAGPSLLEQGPKIEASQEDSGAGGADQVTVEERPKEELELQSAKSDITAKAYKEEITGEIVQASSGSTDVIMAKAGEQVVSKEGSPPIDIQSDVKVSSSEQIVKEEIRPVTGLPYVKEQEPSVPETKAKPSWFSALLNKLFGGKGKEEGPKPSLPEQSLQTQIAEPPPVASATKGTSTEVKADEKQEIIKAISEPVISSSEAKLKTDPRVESDRVEKTSTVTPIESPKEKVKELSPKSTSPVSPVVEKSKKEETTKSLKATSSTWDSQKTGRPKSDTSVRSSGLPKTPPSERDTSIFTITSVKPEKEAASPEEQRSDVRFLPEGSSLVCYPSGVMSEVLLKRNIARHLCDISKGGIRFCTWKKLPQGKKLRFKFKLPKFGDEFSVTAEVRWCGEISPKQEAEFGAGYFVGCKFIDIDPKITYKIEAMKRWFTSPEYRARHGTR